MDGKPPDPAKGIEGDGVGTLEKISSTTERLTLDKLRKTQKKPLRYLLETEKNIKEQARLNNELELQTNLLTYKIRFEKDSGFCYLLHSSFCSPFTQKMRVGDGNCSVKKSEGCKIYQRYSTIKKYLQIFNKKQENSKLEKQALKILKISDYIWKIDRG